ncbi:exo-alpha-sialidase [[Mycoplasma] collis]|uniref:exo-alpha-sialidase n=1 Tax=[Mycoplasma] collis TaxID=2127 RepID=UPI00051C929E|nr:sialidase family protein [[Mycoplasma] collis]
MKVKILSELNLFPSGYLNSHSYRIPSLLKLSNGKTIAIVDQRLDSQLDAPYSRINQIIRISEDGIKWTEGKIIFKLETFREENNPSFIDSVIVEDKINQTIYLAVDVWPGSSGLMPIVEKQNPLSDHFLGFSEDLKYLKLLKWNSSSKFILKPYEDEYLKNRWFRAYEVIDGKWNNTLKFNLKITNIFVDNNFDSETGILKGAVYENINETKNIFKAKPVCSIWDGINLKNPNYKNPKYYISSSPYLYLFKSVNNGLNWELVTNLNNQINKLNPKTNALVWGPGKGLQLQNQVNKEKNGRLMFPLYEVNYALPLSAFVTYSDDYKTWKTSSYLNDPKYKNWNWLSETQIVESKNGTLYAFARNPYQNKLCISISNDGGESWSDLNKKNIDYFSTINYKPINAQIMHGLANFEFRNNEYILLSLPTEKSRKNGKIFIIKNYDFKNIRELFQIDNINDSFGYSTIEILDIQDNFVDFAILYEVSKTRNKDLEWVGFQKEESSVTKEPSEIFYKKLRIEFDN